MKTRIWLAGAALLTLPALGWLAAGRLRDQFSYWIGRHSPDDLQARAQTGFELDRLSVAPDVELVGLIRRPQSPAADGSDAPHRWILFQPGNSADMLVGFSHILGQLFDDPSIGLALWAYRGFDASDGSPTPANLAADLDAQWRRLQQLGATPAQTELWGYSLGSTLAPQLCANMCQSGQAPKRLVLLATAPSIAVRRVGWLGRFAPSDVFCTMAPAGAITCPVVVGHGDRDASLPLAGARKVGQHFEASMFVLEAAGHADLWDAVRRQILQH